MVRSSGSDGANGRYGNGSLIAGSSLRRFRIEEGTEIPRPSFKIAHLVLWRRPILVHDELLAPRHSTARPNCTLPVLAEALLVVVSEKSFCFSKVLFGVGMGSYVHHHHRRFLHAILSVFHAVLSLIMPHGPSCILPRIPCYFEGRSCFYGLATAEFESSVRRGGGDSVFAPASKTTVARDSAISETLLAWEVREGSLGRIWSTLHAVCNLRPI